MRGRILTTLTCLVGAVLLGTWASPAVAQVTAWDEAVNADLSNDGLSPTPVPIVIGTNRVRGTVGNPGSGVDRDYFRFTVPPGAVLSSLVIASDTQVSGSSSFIAIQAGPRVTATPFGGNIGDLLGYAHYEGTAIGTNILPTLVIGYNGPLAAGTYSIWVQETGGVVDYGLDLEITDPSGGNDAPLPPWALLLLGATLAGTLWQRRRNTVISERT